MDTRTASLKIGLNLLVDKNATKYVSRQGTDYILSSNRSFHSIGTE